MGGIRFSDHKSTARVFVDAMDYSWPKLPSDSTQVFDVMKKSIDQGSICLCRGRMDGETCWLIYDEKVFVLEEDFKRTVLCLDSRRLGCRKGNADLGVRFEFHIRLKGDSGNSDLPLIDEALNLASRT